MIADDRCCLQKRAESMPLLLRNAKTFSSEVYRAGEDREKSRKEKSSTAISAMNEYPATRCNPRASCFSRDEKSLIFYAICSHCW